MRLDRCGWLLVLCLGGCVGTYDFDPAQPPEEAGTPTADPAGGDVDPFLSTFRVLELEGVPREQAFEAFLHLDVPAYFTGSDAFPAVREVEVLTPAWDAVGARRRITMADDNTALEAIYRLDPPGSFAYAIWEFSGSSGLVIGYVIAEWTFEEVPGGTRLTWRFNVRPRAWPSSCLLEDAIKEDYQAYMTEIADRYERAVEAAAREE